MQLVVDARWYHSVAFVVCAIAVWAHRQRVIPVIIRRLASGYTGVVNSCPCMTRQSSGVPAQTARYYLRFGASAYDLPVRGLFPIRTTSHRIVIRFCISPSESFHHSLSFCWYFIKVGVHWLLLHHLVHHRLTTPSHCSPSRHIHDTPAILSADGVFQRRWVCHTSEQIDQSCTVALCALVSFCQRHGAQASPAFAADAVHVPIALLSPDICVHCASYGCCPSGWPHSAPVANWGVTVIIRRCYLSHAAWSWPPCASPARQVSSGDYRAEVRPSQARRVWAIQSIPDNCLRS